MKNKKFTTILALLLIITGFLLPTSINKHNLGLATYLIEFILLFFTLILLFRQIDFYRVLLLVFLFILICVQTFFSLFNDYQLGIIPIVSSLFLLYSVETIKIDFDKILITINSISILIFIFSIGIIFNIDSIKIILENYYTGSFKDAYSFAFIRKEPIAIFTSHSIAAFMYFIFFILYYLTWLKFNKIFYLLVSFAYIILIIQLKSYSAIMFVPLILLFILNTKFLLKKPNIIFFTFNTLFLLISFAIIAQYIDVVSIFKGTSTNGLLSRYGLEGVLQSSIQHLQDNFFLGDGLAYSEELTYTDSGYIHNLLLFGISGTILVYYIFLSYFSKFKNVSMLFIVLGFLLFEIGYDLLYYQKAIFLFLILNLFMSSIEDKLIIRIK